MKKQRSRFWIMICILFILSISLTACGKSTSSIDDEKSSEVNHIVDNENTDMEVEEDTMNQIKLTIGSNEIMAKLTDNDSAKALAKLLQDGPITMSASNYGGFEKVCKLTTSITSNDTQITTEVGDVMLYSGNQIVIFYGTNSWAYTRLAKVVDEDLDSLKEVLEKEESTVVIELVNETGVSK